MINPSKIGLVIGAGGKVIRKIEEDTGANLEVESNGEITISGKDLDGVQRAKTIIESLTEEIEIEKIYSGKVVSVRDFGAFVELPGRQEGLVHISELTDGFVKKVEDVVRVGDKIDVKVIAIDEQNRIKLSRKQAMEQVENA